MCKQIDYSAAYNDPEGIEKLKDGRYVLWRVDDNEYGEERFIVFEYPDTRAERMKEAAEWKRRLDSQLAKRLKTL